MELTRKDYQVKYDEDASTITCSGSFRLTSDEYAAISEILNGAADAKPSSLTLDLRNLQFLNSSGIGVLMKYVIRLRNDDIAHVTVKGSNAVPWQRKSLSNLERLLPSLKLELE